MNMMHYPDITPVAFEQNSDTRVYSMLRAALIIVGGSALLWALVVYAVWQVV